MKVTLLGHTRPAKGKLQLSMGSPWSAGGSVNGAPMEVIVQYTIDLQLKKGTLTAEDRASYAGIVQHSRDINMMQEDCIGGPEHQYAWTHSVRLTPVQKKLLEVTKKYDPDLWIGASDQLHLLANLCKAIRAKKTLDIGVFTGYSALTIAMALPEDGKIIACDISDEYTSIGKPFWKEANVDQKIDLRLAPALDTLNSLVENGESGTFDFAFIDADKEIQDSYYELCLKLVRSGGIIAIDDVLWGDKVMDPNCNDEDTVAIKKLNEKLAVDERVDVSMLVLGDGTTLAIKK